MINKPTKLHNSLIFLMQMYLKIIMSFSDYLNCLAFHHNSSISIAQRCCLITLKFNQNMLRRHDFKAILQSITITTMDSQINENQ